MKDLPWQELLLEKGWGCALLIPTSFQADNGAGLTAGVIGLTNKGQPRELDDWGGGTKILRRNVGEQVENRASSAEYHWFAPDFIKFAGPLTPNDLSVDAHHLVALCTPRTVFIRAGASDVEGTWVDAKGMFLGAFLASPIYELLGKKGLKVATFPAQEATLIEFRVY